MKFSTVSPLLLLPPWLFGVAATLSTPSSLRAAPAASNPPGAREVYGGAVCEYAADDGSKGAPVARSGSAQLEVVNGDVTGWFHFAASSQGAAGTTDCRGYLDPATGRGFLKLGPPDPDGSTEKVALLLRRGVLTGGTMAADGQVLAFRLERFLVVLP